MDTEVISTHRSAELYSCSQAINVSNSRCHPELVPRLVDNTEPESRIAVTCERAGVEPAIAEMLDSIVGRLDRRGSSINMDAAVTIWRVVFGLHLAHD
ncbi:hypothetical protein [Halorubrum tropicale]|uniref:hypothetical protein n=1 Tax=Halorubrum tropicale TaxID=1765655 RepID=UPI000A8D7035|nr:hypothetical protein [Halorubrum tropicale]